MTATDERAAFIAEAAKRPAGPAREAWLIEQALGWRALALAQRATAFDRTTGVGDRAEPMAGTRAYRAKTLAARQRRAVAAILEEIATKGIELK